MPKVRIRCQETLTPEEFARRYGWTNDPDRMRLMPGEPGPGRLREWRLPGTVHRLAITTDGRYLFTANHNGDVYVLRLAPPP